jgi:lipid-A-disaccharide synthase-like uncharacterized protein
MGLTTVWQVFIAGFAGGIIIEFLHWWTLRREKRLPNYRPAYWFLSLGMAAAGGGLALLYFGSRADGIVALHVGVSAPIILQKLATTIAEPVGAKGTRTGLWSFLRW